MYFSSVGGNKPERIDYSAAVRQRRIKTARSRPTDDGGEKIGKKPNSISSETNLKSKKD